MSESIIEAPARRRRKVAVPEPGEMGGAEFSVALDVIGWPNRLLAGKAECSEFLVRSWRSGRIRVPGPIAEAVRALRAAHEANPIPRTWPGRRGAA